MSTLAPVWRGGAARVSEPYRIRRRHSRERVRSQSRRIAAAGSCFYPFGREAQIVQPLFLIGLISAHECLNIVCVDANIVVASGRSEEHTSELQSLMRISYAVFCLKKKKQQKHTNN